MVNTGDGKGKSSAAFGMMVRGVARGWNVAVVQFIKSGDWKVGEEKIGRQLGVDWHAFGDGFTWDSDDLDQPTVPTPPPDGEQAVGIIDAGEHQLVILDELTYLMNFNWLPVGDVVAAIADRPPHVNIIVTGRDAPAELVDTRRHRHRDARSEARVPAGHPRHARHRLLSTHASHVPDRWCTQRQEHASRSSSRSAAESPVTFIATAPLPPLDSPDDDADGRTHRAPPAERPDSG